MFKSIFRFRGFRLKMYHRKLLFLYGLLLSVPFLLLLAVYHFYITYPYFSKSTDFTKWQMYIQPVLVTIFFLVVAFFTSSFLIDRSVYKGGFFSMVYKKQLFASYLYDNRFVITRKKKTEKGTIEKTVFPPVYYRSKKGKDLYMFKIGNQFQDKFLQIGKDIENLFISDLISVERERGYVLYEFLSDVSSRRISIQEVKNENGEIMLMEGVSWNYDEFPHMLIGGGTGGGKTYFLYSLILGLMKEGRVHIADPKNSDLSNFSLFPAFEGLVESSNEGIFKQMEEAVELMEKRFVYMKQHKNYTYGKNYRFYGMRPEFFIVDEWAAFISVLRGNKMSSPYSEAALYTLIFPLIMKARQAGVFLILAMQKPTTDVLVSSIRDQLMCRVSLGTLSEFGYEAVFGGISKQKAFINKKKIKGRGYIDNGSEVPTEFYAPFIDKKFDFVDTFQKQPKMPFTDVSNIELTSENLEEIAEEQRMAEEMEVEIRAEKQREERLRVQEEKERKRNELFSNANLSEGYAKD